MKIFESLPSLKSISKVEGNKINSILYDSIADIYISTKQVKKIVSIEGNYHSYTFPILNPKNKNHIENLFLSEQKNGHYKVFRVIYSFDENDIDNIRNGKLVYSKGKTKFIELKTGFDVPQFTNKSGFPPTCAIVAVTYCSDNNHPGGYNPNGSNCPAHEEYFTEFCTGGDNGGGTPDWPTYDDSGTGGSGDTTGGSTTDPNDDTCIADANGNCIGDTTTPTLPPPYSINYTDVFFEALGGINLKAWWAVYATPEFKSRTISFLLDEGYSEEAEDFALQACIANKNGAQVDFDDKIIIDPTFENNQRLKAIYTTFKTGNNTITHYLQNFEPTASAANLIFKTDDNFKSNQETKYWTAGAITSAPVNYLIDVTFNTDPNLTSSAQNFPKIILAQEFMHEVIHAEMYRKLLSYAQQPEIPWTRGFIHSLKNDFPGLEDYYTRYWLELPPNQAPTSAQHQLMAQHYIDIMAQALKDYDNNQHTPSFYEALAWIGLKETVAWDGNDNKTAINLIIQNANQNEPYN